MSCLAQGACGNNINFHILLIGQYFNCGLLYYYKTASKKSILLKHYLLAICHSGSVAIFLFTKNISKKHILHYKRMASIYTVFGQVSKHCVWGVNLTQAIPPYSETWWWQHHAVGLIYFKSTKPGRVRIEGQTDGEKI